MQEEFEKKVQERVHTFGLQPSPQVWGDIDAVLGKRKHRRIFIGWWILLGLVIAGGGILFYEKDNILRNELNQHPVPATDTLQQINLVQAAPATPANGQKTDQNETQQNTAKENTIQPQQGITPQQQSTNTAVTQSYTKSNTFSSKKNTGISIHNGSIGSKQNTAPVASQPLNNDGQKDNQPVKQDVTPAVPQAGNSTTQTTPAVQSPGIAGTDKPAGQKQPPAAAPPGTAKDTAAAATPGKIIIPKTIATVRHQWFFTIGSGITQTTSHSTFNSTEKSFTGNVSQNVLALTAPAAYKYNISKPTAGYHITAGLAYQYKLSPHVRLTTGLQAAYLSNTQKTGNYIKSSFYVSADVDNYGLTPVISSRGTFQSSYYLAAADGSTYTVVNKAWQVQVPVNISYVINPRAKTKLVVNAGGSYGWMFNSRWLIPDSRYEKLYYNKTLLNNNIISWQAGPGVEFSNNIKLGIQYQQSFTTFAKQYVTPKMYWQNISVNAAIPLNIKFKKNKR